MSRNLTSGWIAAASAPLSYPFLMFAGIFPSANVYLWTGTGTITWNAITWQGNGYLRNVTGHDESSAIQASGVQVEFTGTPSLQLSFALSEMRQNADGKIYLGFLDSSGAVIADPYLMFEGRLDACQVVDGPDITTVLVTYESRLIDLERMPACRYTDESQRSFYPNDGGFRYVHKYTTKAAQYWGAAGSSQVHSSKKKSTRTSTHSFFS